MADTNDQMVIPVVELARELKTQRGPIHKIVKRLGIVPMDSRLKNKGNQKVKVITHEEADRVRDEYWRNAKTAAAESGGQELPVGGPGIFYLLQLEPELDPSRIKLGWTSHLDNRLTDHRCSAPFVICIKTWPCRSTWESAALDCLGNGLERLHTEIFRGADVEELVRKGNEFFGLLPEP